MGDSSMDRLAGRKDPPGAFGLRLGQWVHQAGRIPRSVTIFGRNVTIFGRSVTIFGRSVTKNRREVEK